MGCFGLAKRLCALYMAWNHDGVDMRRCRDRAFLHAEALQAEVQLVASTADKKLRTPVDGDEAIRVAEASGTRIFAHR